MNYPQYQQPGFQPPMQQPQQYPQQPMQQPQFPTQQPGFAPPLAQAAGANLFRQFLSEPPRKRADRAKPADGTYVVQFTQNCKVDFSQKDGRPYLLLEYRVIEGTVPQMNGQTFSIPMMWSNRMQMQDLADFAKYVFGMNLPQVMAQAQDNPQIMAQFIAQTVVQGYFAGVRVKRTQKQVQTVGYEQAFANHYWIAITPPTQPITLAQLNVSAQPVPQPFQPPMQQPPQQSPQQQFQQAFQLPQQQPPPQTMMPQPPQHQFQQPQPGMFQPPAIPPQQPGGLPQAPPAGLPQAQPSPAPAYFVPQSAPGALPQR